MRCRAAENSSFLVRLVIRSNAITDAVIAVRILEPTMRNIIYLIGLVVVIVAVLSFLGVM